MRSFKEWLKIREMTGTDCIAGVPKIVGIGVSSTEPLLNEKKKPKKKKKKK